MQDTVEDLKVIYSELKSCLLQTDDSLNPKASVLESEVTIVIEWFSTRI